MDIARVLLRNFEPVTPPGRILNALKREAPQYWANSKFKNQRFNDSLFCLATCLDSQIDLSRQPDKLDKFKIPYAHDLALLYRNLPTPNQINQYHLRP